MNPSLSDAHEDVMAALAGFQENVDAIASEISEYDDLVRDRLREIDRCDEDSDARVAWIEDLEDSIGRRRRLHDEAYEIRGRFLEQLEKLEDRVSEVLCLVEECELPDDDPGDADRFL